MKKVLKSAVVLFLLWTASAFTGCGAKDSFSTTAPNYGAKIFSVVTAPLHYGDYERGTQNGDFEKRGRRLFVCRCIGAKRTAERSARRLRFGLFYGENVDCPPPFRAVEEHRSERGGSDGFKRKGGGDDSAEFSVRRRLRRRHQRVVFSHRNGEDERGKRGSGVPVKELYKRKN